MSYQKKNLLTMITAVILSLCMSMMLSVTGYAATGDEDSVIPMSIDGQKTVSLSISSGTATSSVKVKGEPGGITKIAITMYLQKKSSSGSYSTIATWSGSKKSYYYSLKKSKSVSKGTYRVKARITCYKNGKSESSVHFSNTKAY